MTALLLAAVLQAGGGCPAASLRCFDLVPVPALRGAAGLVELGRPPTPFAVAVERDGRVVHELAVTVRGLPDPRALGSYTSYVAWVTTPALAPEARLGEVGAGRRVVGRVAWPKFLVLVTAEPSAAVARRSGPLVLRGFSPSNLLLPLDPTDLPPALRAGGHDHDAAGGWVAPPMHPAVPAMAPGLHALRPAGAPFVPAGGRDPLTLPPVRPREVVTLHDGDSLDLEAAPVRRWVAGRALVMYGFNAQHPGPLIRVGQHATIVVRFTNRLDLPSTIHWHGVRLDNAFDGVPHVTQEPVPPGGSFRYVVRFPDAGVYWYHPHVREDIQQDLGLYGNLFVGPAGRDWLAPVHREEFLMLDDFLVGEGGSGVPHGRDHATHALMGRFGNVLLVNGEPRWRLGVRRGEVVRLFLTNASNTRTFNVSLDGVRLKLVGSDVGLFERDEWVESVVLAPAERYIVEARFDRPGPVALMNRVQGLNRVAGVFFAEADTLGAVEVAEAAADPRGAPDFDRLRQRPQVTAEVARYRSVLARRADHALALTLRADSLAFGLVQALRLDTAYVPPLEWSGTMPMMDWLSTAREVTWVLRDEATGRENMDVAWRFRRGDAVKLRLTNDRHTLHPMAHPIHIHGQRFLVLAVDGVPADNLVWKDTVLLPVGSSADILLEVSNPGRWMLHCHIAEHLEAGMHLTFTVDP